FRRTVERAADQFRRNPGDAQLLERFDKVVSLCSLLPFQVNLWSAQNANHLARSASAGELAGSEDWQNAMDRLGAKLGFHIESPRWRA
ncbi:hypothetical protein, partial [Enterococcus casseliflavus]|uniref:hypothetical protein n=1 Tax=Enterococcus casseliflavus TaxID=37734 RepID=UPI003D10C0E9